MIYAFILIAVVCFAVTAWMATHAYSLGLPHGRKNGRRLLAAAFAGVAALALLPGDRPSPPSVSLTTTAEASYVAHDVSQIYHLPGCPYAKGALPIVSTKGRFSCRYCLEGQANYQRTAYRPGGKDQYDAADSGQHIQPASLIHEQSPSR